MSRTSLRCRYAGLVAFAEARDCNTPESRRIRPIRQRPSMPGQMSLPFRDDDGGGGDDGCGRQSGGRFGPRNTCQDAVGGVAATESTVEKLKAVQDIRLTYTGDDIPAAFKGAESVEFGKIGSPAVTAVVIEELGFTLSKIAGMSPGSTEKGSQVAISGMNFQGRIGLQVASSVSIDPGNPDLGSATIKVDIEKGTEGNPLREAGDMGGVRFDDPVQTALHLDFFQVDMRAKSLIAKSHAAAKKQADQGESSLSPEEMQDLQAGARVERALGAKIMSLTINAIEAAEKAGVDGVYTFAAGTGTGRPNLGTDANQAAYTTFRGYALWGRFGLDGEISRGGRVWEMLQQIASNPDHPDRDILSTETWAKFDNGQGKLMLQDILETKKGEKLWKEYGSGGNFALNLKDKDSKGYKRYQRMKKLTARARESGQERDFFLWLMDNAESRDYGDFFRIERRCSSLSARHASLLAFYEARNCGTGTGGFRKGNTCAGEKAKEAAVGAIKGAATGATIAATFTEFYAPAVAGGAGAGAVVGAVKGLYDNAMRPTRVTKAIERIGSTDQKITNIVKGLGGTPKSIASTQGKNVVTLDVRNDKNERVFGVAISKNIMIVRPSRKTGRLTKDEIASIKKMSQENTSQHTAIIVEKKSPSYLSFLAKAGFKFAVSQAGAMMATLSCSACPVVIGTAIESISGVELESLGKRR